jgi:N-acetylmuramoyl-L-alanine amidase
VLREGPGLPPQHIPRYCWILDAGHGPLTEGKRSPILQPTVEIYGVKKHRLFEYLYNRDIVERIIEQMSALGLLYARTLPAEGRYGNALDRRLAVANAVPTDLSRIFISVHGNAGPAKNLNVFTDDSIRGYETWHFHGSRRGRALASVFHRHIVSGLQEIVAENQAQLLPGFEQQYIEDRGLKSKRFRQFTVLRETDMPAILTENLFFNNRYDLQLMIREDVRQAIADAHVDAIVEVELKGYAQRV